MQPAVGLEGSATAERHCGTSPGAGKHDGAVTADGHKSREVVGRASIEKVTQARGKSGSASPEAITGQLDTTEVIDPSDERSREQSQVSRERLADGNQDPDRTKPLTIETDAGFEEEMLELASLQATTSAILSAAESLRDTQPARATHAMERSCETEHSEKQQETTDRAEFEEQSSDELFGDVEDNDILEMISVQAVTSAISTAVGDLVESRSVTRATSHVGTTFDPAKADNAGKYQSVARAASHVGATFDPAKADNAGKYQSVARATSHVGSTFDPAKADNAGKYQSVARAASHVGATFDPAKADNAGKYQSVARATSHVGTTFDPAKADNAGKYQSVARAASHVGATFDPPENIDESEKSQSVARATNHEETGFVPVEADEVCENQSVAGVENYVDTTFVPEETDQERNSQSVARATSHVGTTFDPGWDDKAGEAQSVARAKSHVGTSLPSVEAEKARERADQSDGGDMNCCEVDTEVVETESEAVRYKKEVCSKETTNDGIAQDENVRVEDKKSENQLGGKESETARAAVLVASESEVPNSDQNGARSQETSPHDRNNEQESGEDGCIRIGETGSEKQLLQRASEPARQEVIVTEPEALPGECPGPVTDVEQTVENGTDTDSTFKDESRIEADDSEACKNETDLCTAINEVCLDTAGEHCRKSESEATAKIETCTQAEREVCENEVGLTTAKNEVQDCLETNREEHCVKTDSEATAENHSCTEVTDSEVREKEAELIITKADVTSPEKTPDSHRENEAASESTLPKESCIEMTGANKPSVGANGSEQKGAEVIVLEGGFASSEAVQRDEGEQSAEERGKESSAGEPNGSDSCVGNTEIATVEGECKVFEDDEAITKAPSILVARLSGTMPENPEDQVGNAPE